VIQKRILLVDDEESILFALRRYFSRLGYAVDTARELEEAEALLANYDYAVVIADLSLTDNGSTEGLEIVRFSRYRSRETRVILLTAYGSPEIEREAMRRGIDAFLHKPKPLPEIADIVTTFIGGTA
jgi:DNA-binding response OmpR family regulator